MLSNAQKIRWKCVPKSLAVTFAAVPMVFGMASLAHADDDTRIKELEAKLERSMDMIQSLSQKVNNLQQKGTAGYSHSLSEERLNMLEEQVFNIDDRVGSRAAVNAFDAAKIDIGGFLHNTLTHVDGKGGSATSFNRTIFEILLKADLGDNWSAFFAQAFLRQAGESFTNDGGNLVGSFSEFNPTAGQRGVITDTPIAWANYKHNDQLNVRAGRILTPAGIINIEHFPASLLDPEQPQFLRPFGGNTVLPNFLTGVNVHGRKFVGNNTLQYDAYTGNFAGSNKRFITGGRLAYGLTDLGVTVGANVMAGKRPSGDEYEVYGGDILIDKGKLLWKNEAFFTNESGGNDNRTAFYSQPAWRITDKFTGFYRYDYLDNGTATTIENVVGLAYKPTRNVHLRTIFRNKHFKEGFAGITDSQDAQIYQLSATYNF